MAEYHFKIADDGNAMDAMLKMLSMLQDQDYSVSVDADNHTLTVVTKGKKPRNNSVKKTIKKTRRKLFWKNAWKRICDWVHRKGYWIITLIVTAGYIMNPRTPKIWATIAVEVMIIVTLLTDELN